MSKLAAVAVVGSVEGPPPHPPTLVGPFLTTKQAAEYCGMPTQSLYNRLSQGTGPKVHKHGKRNKFLTAELDEWMTVELSAASAV